MIMGIKSITLFLPSEYSLAHVQENGFIWPLLFRDKSKLGIQIPDKDFTINDVRLCVGESYSIYILTLKL